MTQQKMKFAELPGKEKKLLEVIYGPQPTDDSGYSPNRIRYVRELTEYEKSLLGSRMLMSSNFLTQTLYKIKGTLIPIRFNRVLHDAIARMDALRTNYYRSEECPMAMVFQERKTLPQVTYRNMESIDSEDLDSTLRNIMEADMREGIDLQQGNLIRFSVFHTDADEYAVLVTMAQVLMAFVDVRALFCEVMGQSSEKIQVQTDLGISSTPMESSLRDYWSKVLEDLPPLPMLPYTKQSGNHLYRQKVYRKRIPPDIMSNLREFARSNKMMLMAILQTAWGILLQESSAREDVFFCLLVPGRRGQGGKVAEIGDFFRMMPVRCKSPEDLSVKKLVGQQFQQTVISQPYSCFDWKGMQEITGNRANLFDHFLSFYDFMMDEQVYSEIRALPEGAFVLRNSWDAGGSRLGVYFRYGEMGVSFTIMYNENQFIPMGGMLLAQRYLRVLQQMITDWNLPYLEFLQNLKRRIAADKTGELAQRQQDLPAHMQDVFSRLKLLHESDVGLIHIIIKAAVLVTKFEGDRISGDEIENNLVFISRGRVARNIDTGDGWYNTLDILKDGAWINETVMLSQRTSRISAEVLTEEAEILLIPLSAMRDILVEHPKLWPMFLQHVLKQMEKYQRLWIQS